MNIRWKLRMAAAQREVWTGTQLRRLLAERAGLELSAASVSALFTKEPAQVKLSTLAALCTALECTPNDLFEVDTTPVTRPAPPRPVTDQPKAAPAPARGRGMPPLLPGVHGKEAAGLRRVRRASRHHRPRALLPVLAEDHRGRGQDDVPQVREAAGPSARYRAVRAVLAGLHAVRPPGPPPRGHLVPGLPAQGPAGRGPAALPAMRPGGISAGGYRLVRPVFAAPPAERPASGVRAMRAGQTARGAGVVLGVLAAPSRTALRPGRSPGRPAHRPAWLAGRLHRAPGRRERARPGLHDDH